MAFTISINGGLRRITTDGTKPLFHVLRHAGVAIPSACGGRGRCGLCRVQIRQDTGPRTEPEEKRGLESGWRFSCQIHVREDLDITLPPDLVKARDFTARVAAIEPLTHDIRRIVLELPAPGLEQPFLPGQYMQFEVPGSGCHDGVPVTRTYSMASAAAEARRVEFFIRYVPNGLCTTWIFRHLKPGDEIRVCGPFGDFHVRESSRPAVFIAGGSGLAPFASILEDLCRHGSKRTIRLFFGARSRRDLYFLDELRAYEQRLADFRFIPALSEPRLEDAWTGETGLITDVVGRHFQDCSAMEAYLCGSPGMIDACIRVLEAKGLPADRIFFDKY